MPSIIQGRCARINGSLNKKNILWQDKVFSTTRAKKLLREVRLLLYKKRPDASRFLARQQKLKLLRRFLLFVRKPNNPKFQCQLAMPNLPRPSLKVFSQKRPRQFCQNLWRTFLDLMNRKLQRM